MANHITATVATRGRYGTTLPQTLAAIANQTRPPDDLLIIDDNPASERKDLLKHPVVTPILAMLTAAGVKAYVVEGLQKGPHVNHEQARQQAKDLIWRVDDDEIPEPEVLQCLEKHLIDNPKVGAAAGLVPVPPMTENAAASCALEDVFDCKNVQWYNWPAGTVFDNAGHLHSSYLYRKHAAQFRTDLSPVGHCEESFHTIDMVRNGWRLVIDTNVTTWHCRQPTGGIRVHNHQEWYEQDFAKFVDWCKTLPVKWRRTCNVLATAGVGDVWAAATVMPKIIEYQRARGVSVRIFCRPDDMPLFAGFAGDGVTVRELNDVLKYELRHDGNIYAWMARDSYKGGLPGAFVHYYTEGYPLWLGY